MKLAFGTLNATLAKTITLNMPKRYRKIIEPFGDGGTLAFDTRKKKPKEHVLNIFGEELFAAFQFVQTMTGADKTKLKKFDWIGSQETFDTVAKISAEAGPERFYKFLYTKKLGMAMEPDMPPEFDILSTGKDISHYLYSLPLMRVGLKGVTLTNEDPLSVIEGGGDTFTVLLPKTTEEAESVRGKITGLGGNFFFAAKVPDAESVLDDAKKYSNFFVSPLSAPSIMMNKMSVILNYESKIEPIDQEGQIISEKGMSMEKKSLRTAFRRLFFDALHRIRRREETDFERMERKNKLIRSINDYYVEIPNYLELNLLPVYLSYFEAQKGYLTPDDEQKAKELCRNYISKHIETVKIQVEKGQKYEIEDMVDLILKGVD